MKLISTDFLIIFKIFVFRADFPDRSLWQVWFVYPALVKSADTTGCQCEPLSWHLMHFPSEDRVGEKLQRDMSEGKIINHNGHGLHYH